MTACCQTALSRFYLAESCILGRQEEIHLLSMKEKIIMTYDAGFAVKVVRKVF